MNPPPVRAPKRVRLFTADGDAIDLPSVLALMDAWADAALLVAEDRRVLATNACLRRFLGVHADTVVGRDAYELLVPDGGAPEECPLETAVREGLDRRTHTWERRDTGRWLEATVTLTPFLTRRKRRVYLFRQRDVSEREEILRQSKLRTQELEALRDLLLLDPALPMGMLLLLVLERLVDLSWLGVQRRGAAFLWDGEGTLSMEAAVGLSPTAVAHCARVPGGQCLCGKAAAAGELIYAAEVGREHSRRHADLQPHGHYCVPLAREDRLLGVLTFYLPAGHRRSRREEAFLRSAASVVAVMVERSQTRAELDGQHRQALETLEASLRTMGGMVAAQDPATAAHQQRVAELAELLGLELGLDEERTRRLRWAASLHDIGKIGLPREARTGAGSPSPEGEAQLREHVVIGHDFLRSARFGHGVAELVLQHHERWDGSGYPLGLAGEAIALEARVIAVADVVEAVASERAHQGALGLAAGGAALLQGRGSLYDPRVVDAFMALVQADRLPGWLAEGRG